ncbi:MAG: type II toxin-antitoxin system PemK/MazF family toxin [Actinomycetota bacterium]|nr:type II toxin-antitoxin system PemK/MazF family toxin [Actinomycetota bacterium]
MVTARDLHRGDVWWFEPPTMKRRPVVILTRDDVLPRLNQLIVAPATRHVRSIPTEVPLNENDGMPTVCVVTLDNVLAVRPAFLTSRITSLGADRMHQICRALQIAIDC